MKILRQRETKFFLQDVITNADIEKESFGFLCHSAYIDSAEKGNLWIATIDNEYAGHVLFGGKYPSIKIFQIYTLTKFRHNNVATNLLKELISYSQKHDYQFITAKVASELKSNAFWQKNHFDLVSQISGSGRNPRLINRYVLDIDRNPLFIDSKVTQKAIPSELLFHKTPLQSVPIYSIDLNVFFDYIRSRKNEKYVSQLISLSLSGHIRLVITSEFTEELKRNAKPDDPVLRFSENLKKLPEINNSLSSKLFDDIYSIIFRSKRVKTKENDISDIKHIVNTILNGINGFITSEKKILAKANIIQMLYKIEILSPYELFYDDFLLEKQDTLAAGTENIHFNPISGPLSNDNLNFISYKSLDQRCRTSIISSEFNIKYNINYKNITCGFICINTIKQKYPIINSYIILNEQVSEIYYIIDWCLQLIYSCSSSSNFCNINIKALSGSEILNNNLKSRGFLKSKITDFGFLTFNKICVNCILNSKLWPIFNDYIANQIGYSFPDIFPSYNEINNSGILLRNKIGDRFNLDLFKFETLFSPVLLLCKNRKSLIIPIRKEYAETFFPILSKQFSLIPNDIVSVSYEKAYFRSPRNYKKFTIGMLVFFYVSGHKDGYMEVIGYGRITYSGLTDVSNLSIKFYRQGVLSEADIIKLSENNLIHVITFDNFKLLDNRISYTYLKENAIISEANLVTSELIDYASTIKLLNKGTNGEY